MNTEIYKDPAVRAKVEAALWFRRTAIWVYVKYIIHIAVISVFLYFDHDRWALLYIMGFSILTGMQFDLSAAIAETEKRMTAADEAEQMEVFHATLESMKSRAVDGGDGRH